MSNIIKNAINASATNIGFKKAFGHWYKESEEVIVVLNLQKSGYSSLYYLNIKIYIIGIFNFSYEISKRLIINDTGDIFRREPVEYKSIMNLDNEMDDFERVAGIERMFKDFMAPFVDKALTLRGILVLVDENKIFLLPAVKIELEKLLENRRTS